jgi:hypothetical protein
MIIKTKSGEGFKSDQAARIWAGKLHLKEFKVIPVPGVDGAKTKYALETDEVVEQPVLDNIEESAKHRVTKPWQPATLLHIPEDLKDPDYTYRFCVNEESRPGNIRKKLAEGWEIDKWLLGEMKKRGLLHLPTVDDGKPLDSTLTVREMVVMRMDKETAKSRNAYYDRRANVAADNAEDEYKGKAKSLGVETYGDIKEQQGDEI